MSKKISSLDPAVAATDADLIEIVQGGVNVKAALSVIKTWVQGFVGTLDTDGTLAANSDTRLASQKAVKTYADGLIAANDAMVLKGVTDCSGNPNYPAANRGDTYKVSVAGKIGGASGIAVEAGDMFICVVDGTATGNQASVGANWGVIQTNLVNGPWTAWTPTITDNAGAVTTTGVSGRYEQVGKTVRGTAKFTFSSGGGSSWGLMSLPVVPNTTVGFAVSIVDITARTVLAGYEVTNLILMTTAAGAYPFVASHNYVVSFVYEAS